MNKQTICGAALETLKRHGKPMSGQEIFDFIIQHNLYQFKAKNPLSILKAELRKHCEGINPSERTQVKYFQLQDDGSFWIKDTL